MNVSNRPASAGVTASPLRNRIAAHITQIPRTVSKSDLRENCHGFVWRDMLTPVHRFGLRLATPIPTAQPHLLAERHDSTGGGRKRLAIRTDPIRRSAAIDSAYARTARHHCHPTSSMRHYLSSSSRPRLFLERLDYGLGNPSIWLR
jgi:hypothetical protein